MKTHDELIAAVKELDSASATAWVTMDGIVRLLHRERPYYNWVGFYLLEGSAALVLGPYVGKPTPHVRIPLNQGICGAAASSGETLIVDDVTADVRYLACSVETRSEIVVPIHGASRVLGEIDVDSDAVRAFGPNDRRLLEEIAAIVARRL